MFSRLEFLDEMPWEYEEVIWVGGAGCGFRNDWNASTNGYLAPFLGIALSCSVDDRVVKLEILQHCVSLGRGAVDEDFLFSLDFLPDEPGNLLFDFVNSRSKLEIGIRGVQRKLSFACT